MVSFVWGGLASVRVPHLSGTWVLGVWGMGRRVCVVGGVWCVMGWIQVHSKCIGCNGGV
jgi:hypothetical protein